MKEIVLANNAFASFPEEEEEVDRLSFCNLPLEENNRSSIHHSPRTSCAQTDPLFEFFTSHTVPPAHSNRNDIVFCGKIIREEEEEQLNEYQKRDYFANIRSQSFRKPDRDAVGAENRLISASCRFSGEHARPKCSTGDLDYHAQRVNITSLTSMSEKSKRRMFMFGPVKFRPEMELSAIKERQARQPSQEKKMGRMEVERSTLRRRSHLTSVLARSFGCIPLVAGGAAVERRVGMANRQLGKYLVGS